MVLQKQVIIYAYGNMHSYMMIYVIQKLVTKV